MKYLQFTYIDRVTKKPVTQEPAFNGPILPEIKNLTLHFSLESKYPTSKPMLFGYVNDNDDLNINNQIPGVIKQLSKEDYKQIKDKELEYRKEQLKKEIDSNWKKKIDSGVKYKNVYFSTDDVSRQLISSVSQVALTCKVNKTIFKSVNWDGKDENGEDASLTLNANQVLELQALIVSTGEILYNKLRNMYFKVKSANDFTDLEQINTSFE